MPKKRLTEAAVAKVRPPNVGRKVYVDALRPGLELRVTCTGHKSWSLRYRVAGRQRRIKLGDYPRVQLKEARRRAQETLSVLDRGDDPAEVRRKKQAEAERREKNTVAAVADVFMQRHVIQLRSSADYESCLRNHILPQLGSRPIHSVTRRDVIELLDRMKDRGTPGATNRAHSTLSKMFSWAVERGIVETSPVANIRPPVRLQSRDRVLSDAEIALAWAAFDKMGFPFGHLLQFLLTTGQRLSEVAKLCWDEVDLDKRTWSIPREKVKADRTHEVPLSTLAVDILEAATRSPGQYVFSTTGGERPVSGFSKMKVRADRLSGVAGWRVHDLRRTCGTGMARLGVSNAIIGRVLNHAESGVTHIYSRHSRPEEKRRALEIWARQLQAIVGQSVKNVVELRRDSHQG